MFAFELELNGERMIVGAENWALLSVHVVAIRPDASPSVSNNAALSADVQIGGLAQEDPPEQILWQPRHLPIGAKLTIVVVDSDGAALERPTLQPHRTEFADKDDAREKRRRAYLKLKAEFESS